MNHELLLAVFLSSGMTSFSQTLPQENAGLTQTSLQVTVKNESNVNLTDKPIILSLNNDTETRSALVTYGDEEISSQLDDLNGDDRFDELCFLANLAAGEERTYNVQLCSEGEPRRYEPRVYVEMVMRNDKVKQKNRQNNYIESLTARGDCAYSYNLQHHHGVAFESELTGVRIYFDARQTLDLYGKFHKGLELQQTQFYTSDEQKAQGYGDDVLWVGQTFGLGAFRGWDGQHPTHVEPVASRTQRIVSYGPLRTIVEVIDRGWRPDSLLAPVTMTQRYILYGGHRDIDVQISFDRDVAPYRFSTGVINVKGSREFSDKRGLRACWGTDYPAADTLKWKPETVGLAVLVPSLYVAEEVPADKDNYTLVLATEGNMIRYSVAACSGNEDFGFGSAEEWFNWLSQWRREQEAPVSLTVTPLSLTGGRENQQR